MVLEPYLSFPSEHGKKRCCPALFPKGTELCVVKNDSVPEKNVKSSTDKDTVEAWTESSIEGRLQNLCSGMTIQGGHWHVFEAE